MKFTHVVAVIALVGSACSASQPNTVSSTARPDSRLVGTWELVSTRITSGQTTLIEGAAPEIRAFKVLNSTDYSVITRRGQQFMRAGTGRYTLSGDTYTETVDLASTGSFNAGQVYTFRISLDGDRWMLDGGSGAQRLQEVWRRIR